jgi:steroid 5-alpha reductase family enzyme
MSFIDLATLLASNLALLLLALIALWAVSVRIKDASIIDIAWGPACAFGPLLTLWRADGASPRDILLTALVTLWAARLALHLAQRNLGHGEDFRYARMREKQGSDAAFARWSLVRVYGLQGVIAWFVSWPAQLGQLGADKPLGSLTFLGAGVFALGLAFEAIGDEQLKRFKADPANKGKLMTKGLWAWTRHPNYFGDAAVWIGLTLIALEGPYGWATILSPAVMAFFLVNVSGKAMLERAMEKKYPDYSAYKATTSGFLPLPPGRRGEL